MRSLFEQLRRFLAELRRRNVYRVGVAYGVVAFVTLQVAELIFPATTLEGLYDEVVFVVFVGFPIALILAWALELTPEGVKPTETEAADPHTHEERPAGHIGWMGVAFLLVLLGGGWWLVAQEAPLMGFHSSSAADSTRTVTDRSIAVLPFENLSGSDTTSSLAPGLHEDLLTRLANVSDLQVTSRTSVQQIQEANLTLPAIAETLDVRWVLEGSVAASGGQIDVTAQLIDPRRDIHIWANDYQRELTAENLFAIQGEIAGEIANALQAELSPGEQRRIVGAPTENLAAYRDYVRGRRLLGQVTGREDPRLRQAATHFGQALAKDSTFALAWAGLADAIGQGVYEVYPPDSLALPAVTQEAAARRAIEQAPDLAEARAALGQAYFDQQNAPAALRELRRAVELKPSYAHAHSELAKALQVIGRFDESFRHIQIAEELNPQHRDARHGLFDTYNRFGQHKRALAEARQQQRLFPDDEAAIWAEIRSLSHLGRHEKAIALAEKRLANPESQREQVVMRSHLAIIQARAGDTTQARQHVEALEEMDIDPEQIPAPHMHGQLAAAYKAVGNLDAAFREYGQIDEWPLLTSIALRRDTVLSNDPRYEELIREINQYWGLNPDGSRPNRSNTPTKAKADV